MIIHLARRFYCWAYCHAVYVDRGAAACLRCGRRWIGRAHD